MNLQDYQKIVEETAIYPKEFGLGYTTLGLVGEFQEFCNTTTDKGLTKEFGDVCWYLTALCKEADFNLFTTFVLVEEVPLGMTREILVNQANLYLGEVAEIVKKYYRDGAKVETFINLQKVLQAFSKYLTTIAVMMGVDVEEALQINYTKLILRKQKNMIQGSGDDREEA